LRGTVQIFGCPICERESPSAAATAKYMTLAGVHYVDLVTQQEISFSVRVKRLPEFTKLYSDIFSIRANPAYSCF
jgi:hypothetical protein